MGRLKEIPEHALACARRLYEDTDVPMDKIAALLGICQRTLQFRASLLHWTPRPGIRRQRGGAAPADMDALKDRIRTMIGNEIVEAERILGRTGPAGARVRDSERSARTLASLARTLNELKRLEASGSAAPSKADEQHHTEEEIEFDVEEYRRNIARRLDELRASGELETEAQGDDAA
jgi:hypothetical protein